MNHTVNYRLWGTMMYQGKFIDYKKWTTFVKNVDYRGGYVYVGIGGIWEISVTSPQFCYEPKTSLKT